MARLGFASRAALLTVVVAMLWLAFFVAQPTLGSHPTSKQALDLAAAVCWLGSMTALGSTSIGVDANRVPQVALVRMLLAIFARMIPPLATITLAAVQKWPLVDGGLGGYMIAFYLLTLALDTAFALPAVMTAAGSKVETS
jgi:hypothetical protein